MLPKNLKYGSKVESALARSSRVNIQPQNGTSTYQMGDTITINIPTRNNLCLVPTESYLKFNAAFTNGTTVNQAYRWDSCGASGLIQRIRVFHGSNLIQDIDNYGMLVKMLYDLQAPSDATYGKLTVTSGTRSDLVLNAATFAVNQINCGERLGGPVQALTGNGGLVANETYCLNLVSIVGSLCSQNYLPLFALQSAPLRVEIQLVDTVNKAVASLVAGGSFNLTNVEYVANFIELGDPAMSLIQESLQGQPLQFVFPDFRNYQYGSGTVSSLSSTQLAIPVPAKYSSLKSLFLTCRDKLTGASTFFPYSSVKLKLTDYQFRIGATVMPPKSPNTVPEMFCEVLKAIGSIADYNHQPSIDKASYSIDQSAVMNDSATAVCLNSSGSFYLGLDLENYASSNKDSIFAGINSNTDDTFIVLNYPATGLGDITPRYDIYANFDSVFVAENGTAYVKF